MLAAPDESLLLDVLDRVLDKGIVVDAWLRVSLVGIDLTAVQAKLVVASAETYLEHQRRPTAWTGTTFADSSSENAALLGEPRDDHDGPAGVLARLRPGDPPRTPRRPRRADA